MTTTRLDDVVISSLLERTNTADFFQLLYLESDPLLALAYTELFLPEVTAYRGAYFRTAILDAETIDKWFERSDIKIDQIERVCNQIELGYLFGGGQAPQQITLRLANEIARGWRAWLPKLCARDVDVIVSMDDAGSPIVTFCTAHER
ncbi:MAG: hypothetical protein KF779_02310 [Hyphomonadaceae bacterium]|nr:hypothetical protein [Hyphomonadaceae bacterium]